MDPILLIDDEKDNLEALTRLLRKEYEVTAVSSPFEGIRALQKGHFHVIISDQRMPEMTGVEFLEKAKHLAPDTVRILLTGYTDVDSVIGAINRGNIYRYIAKPWDNEELRLTLRQANEAYKLRKEIREKNDALEKTNQELKEAVDQLTLLDRAKARFLSLVSHELNTPLTVVQSFVGLLSQEKKSFPSDLQKAVDSLGVASHRFSSIVGDVLTYVSLESGQPLRRVAMDISHELKSVCEELKIDFKQTEPVPVKGDPTKLRVAFKKILEDALSRSPKASPVLLTLSSEEAEAKLTVQRKGEEISEKAFVVLEADAPEMHHQKNLGLGLAIARTIITAHGGKLLLASSSKQGTVLEIRLPK